MAIDIVLPSLSAGMQDGLIARWLKAEGERAEKGEVIAEIETDKATMELEAASSGRLGRDPDRRRKTRRRKSDHCRSARRQ